MEITTSILMDSNDLNIHTIAVHRVHLVPQGAVSGEQYCDVGPALGMG
jgi:hypothetical protein